MRDFRNGEVFLVGPGGGKIVLPGPSGGTFWVSREDLLGLRDDFLRGIVGFPGLTAFCFFSIHINLY